MGISLPDLPPPPPLVACDWPPCAPNTARGAPRPPPPPYPPASRSLCAAISFSLHRRWAMAGWFHEPSQEFPPWFWELTSAEDAEDATLSAEEMATDS